MSLSRPRVMPNGDLVFPRKGHPPPDNISNYERDPADPFIFHLMQEPCKHRESKFTISPCGKTKCSLWCNLLQREVSTFFCDQCDKYEAG